MIKSLGILLVLSWFSTAHAQISVVSPVNGKSLSSAIWLNASVTSCVGAPSTSFGYSVDSSNQYNQSDSNTELNILDSTLTQNAWHIIRFKAWSAKGQCAEVDSTIFVQAPKDGVITVNSPYTTDVESPVLVVGSVDTCGKHLSTAFGYSVDNSSTMNWGTASEINYSDPNITSGNHILHFKAWSGNVECPTVNVPITVGGGGGGQVSISSPTSGEKATDPFTVIADSTINGTAAMDVWDNGSELKKFSGYTVNYPFSLAVGNHTMTIFALNGSGTAIGKAVVSYSIINGNSYTHVERSAPSGYCDVQSCGGGLGLGTYRQLVNTSQQYPCLDGECLLFSLVGSAWYDVLLYWKFHPSNIDQIRNIQGDFQAYFLGSTSDIQAAEFDLFESLSQTEFMMGGQCNYSSKTRDVWNQQVGSWIHLDGQQHFNKKYAYVPCQLSANTWHHINEKTQIDPNNKTYTYVSLTIDGTNYPINDTEPTGSNNWGDVLGIQWQLDINGNGGSVQELLDEGTLTYW